MSYDASELLQKIGPDRDLCIKQYILAGYVPSWQQMVPVTSKITDSTGAERVLTFFCYPDYLCFGNDYSFVIANMNHNHASDIANQIGCMLPTRKMVNLIYFNAATKLSPTTMQWGPLMQSTDYMVTNSNLIESQKRTKGAVNGTLIAGHKKDVVTSAATPMNPGREAIYGWHQSNYKVIQDLSFKHDTAYSDYSHGARMVLKKGYLDSVEVELADVLADPELCSLISDEGPFRL